MVCLDLKCNKCTKGLGKGLVLGQHSNGDEDTANLGLTHMVLQLPGKNDRSRFMISLGVYKKEGSGNRKDWEAGSLVLSRSCPLKLEGK